MINSPPKVVNPPVKIINPPIITNPQKTVITQRPILSSINSKYQVPTYSTLPTR